MKRMKKIMAGAIAMMTLSTAATVTGTVAWFAANKTVYANGMSVKAEAPSSLVISDTTTFVPATTLVTFNDTYTLKPATLWSNGMQDNTQGHAALAEPNTHLVQVANGEAVDPQTGLAKITDDTTNPVTRANLYYAAVETSGQASSSAAGFYKDYDLYLAAEGSDDFVSGTLKISVEAPASISEKALEATSIAVVYNNAVVGNPIRVNTGVDKQTITALDSNTNKVPSGVIKPSAVINNAMKITLRVYIDGAYEDNANVSTYVRNSEIVDLVNHFLSFGVKFDIE